MDVCDDNEMPVLTVNELPKTSVDEMENVTGSEDCILRVSSMTAESCLLKMFFTPSKNITAKSVFEALANAEIDAAEIACLQR